MIKGSKLKAMNNYLIYALIVIVTITLVIYFRAWYKAYLDHQLTIPVIDGYFNEVKYDELDNYVAENANFALYMCTSNEEKCRDFERQFRKTIKKYSLKDQIVYLNLNEHVDNNNDSILLDMNYGIDNIMNKELFFTSYPSISIFKDRKLFDVIIIRNSVTIDKVTQFLEEHEIIIKH